MSNKRNISAEIIQAIIEIKQGKGRRYMLDISRDAEAVCEQLQRRQIEDGSEDSI